MRLYFLYAFKGIAIGITSICIKSITSFSTWSIHTVMRPFGEFPNYILHIICFIASLLIYNSVIGIFLRYDIISAKEYLTSNNLQSNKIKAMYGDTALTTEAISATALLSIFAFLGAMPEISGAFYFNEGKSPYSSGLIPLLVTAFFTILIFFISRYEAVRYWEHLKKLNEIDTSLKKTNFIIRLILIIILYPPIIPFSPLIFFFLYSAANVIFAFAKSVTIPVFILILLVFILLVYSIPLISALLKRKKLISAITNTVKYNSYEISKIENPYISILKRNKLCKFALKHEKHEFNCLIVGGTKYAVPICFTSENEGYFRYRIGTKKHNVTLRRHFNLSTNKESNQIIIINPNTKDVFVCEDDKEKRLFNADKLWNSVIYDSDAFLGATERKCLGRYDLSIK